MPKYKSLMNGFEFSARKIVGLFGDGLLLADGTKIERPVKGVRLGDYWVDPGIIWKAEVIDDHSIEI